MTKKWHQATLIKIQEESPTTKRFWLKVEQAEMPFSFRAGQFITIDLPIGETRLDRWRSYSIANAPDESNIVELCIVKLEGGRASKYFFEDIELGQDFRFKGPGGVFTLPKILENDLVFICTGTGVAPFRSMILDLLNIEGKLPNIHLVFGTRKIEGILYRQELEKLAQDYPSFKYSIALSRENTAGTYSGYVHPIYEQAYTHAHKNKVFYLCGWSNMVDEATEILTKKMKVDERRVVTELYG